MEINQLHQRLENEMKNQYRRIRAEVRRYNPQYFINMIEDKGGYQTALSLLTPQKPPEGYITLIEKGRVDLTLEYLIYQDQEFKSLFNEDITKNIERRLRGLI